MHWTKKASSTCSYRSMMTSSHPRFGSWHTSKAHKDYFGLSSIRLPLLQLELALQSHDFFISIAYIMRRRSRQAFCISFVNTALKFVARRRTTCTRLISDLRELRHDKNTIGLNKITATPIAFIPRAHWNINS